MTNLEKFLNWEREKRALSYGVGDFEDTKSEMIKVMAEALNHIAGSRRQVRGWISPAADIADEAITKVEKLAGDEK